MIADPGLAIQTRSSDARRAIKNRLRVIVTSNSEPEGLDNGHYKLLHGSNARHDDCTYWQALHTEMASDQGGAALLRFLLSRNIQRFDPVVAH